MFPLFYDGAFTLINKFDKTLLKVHARSTWYLSFL